MTAARQPSQSDSRFAKEHKPADVRRMARAKPHPEGAAPRDPDELPPEAQADLGEQPSDTNPISDKSGP